MLISLYFLFQLSINCRCAIFGKLEGAFCTRANLTAVDRHQAHVLALPELP